MRKTCKKRGGGFFDSIKSGWGSLTAKSSELWNKTKESASGLTSSFTGSSSSTYTPSYSTDTSSSSTYTPSSSTDTPSSSTDTSSSSTYTPSSSTYTPTIGGKRRNRRHKKRTYRGGSVNGVLDSMLAKTASPYMGGKTPDAQAWVGGKRHRKKTQKHRRKH